METEKKKPGLLTAEMLSELEYISDYKPFQAMLNYFDLKIKTGVFSKDAVDTDLDCALWRAYALLNMDTHDTYVKAEGILRLVEEEGAGSGVWCYRYSGALLFLGEFEGALKYAEQGAAAEPDYPWIWLRVASLRYKFGDTEGALAAVQNGLALVPGDYEFLTMRKEIKAGKSFAQLVNHYIDEEVDQEASAVSRLTRVQTEEKRKRASCYTLRPM